MVTKVLKARQRVYDPACTATDNALFWRKFEAQVSRIKLSHQMPGGESGVGREQGCHIVNGSAKRPHRYGQWGLLTVPALPAGIRNNRLAALPPSCADWEPECPASTRHAVPSEYSTEWMSCANSASHSRMQRQVFSSSPLQIFLGEHREEVLQYNR